MITTVNSRMPDGAQWRFACRKCGKVKVADEQTHSDGPGFICGECEWKPCALCTDPMDCGSWASCHNQGRARTLVDVDLPL
jgi:hypothetical protein